ncbi:MAG: hypothetical protein IKN89_07705 [Oscillospiraceae bacterium]|nr:hypothetical protein [Oscillospiraceae bacterium]
MPEEAAKEIVITVYEKWALIISVTALLIPIIQWAWKKWIVSVRVKYYPTGQATLFFNQSGSYIRFNGVLEAERKAATIKKMSLVLTRKRDERKLNLVWSYLISPVNQSMLGNYVQTTEAAHPFRVEADSVACAFVEYNDPSDSSGIKIRKICTDLALLIKQIVQNRSYDEALAVLSKSPDYIDAKNTIISDFYWEIGKYTAVISVEYGKRKRAAFSFDFTVSEQNHIDLRNNIDESLIAILKDCYRVPLAFRSPMVEVSQKIE